MAKKRRKRNYTNWGQTRRIDGEIYDCYDYNCSKATAERAAKQARAKGYKARVLKGRSNYDYAVYVKQIHLTEHELNVGETIRSSRAGRFRGASLASNLKSEHIDWRGSEAEESKDRRSLAKSVKTLQEKGAIEKIEPETDIEPTYKLTKKGKEVFEYDPSEFEE